MLQKVEAVGLCECGCGDPAPIAKQTKTSCGHIQGSPIRFINGHNQKGELHFRWNERKTKSYGYNVTTTKEGRKLRQSRIKAEKILRKSLSLKIQIHHYAEMDNDNKIVICEDSSYHNLLHKRLRAYRATGNPKAIFCRFCKQYDDIKNLKIYNKSAQHPACANRYAIKRRKKIKEGGNA